MGNPDVGGRAVRERVEARGVAKLELDLATADDQIRVRRRRLRSAFKAEPLVKGKRLVEVATGEVGTATNRS